MEKGPRDFIEKQEILNILENNKTIPEVLPAL